MLPTGKTFVVATLACCVASFFFFLLIQHTVLAEMTATLDLTKFWPAPLATFFFFMQLAQGTTKEVSDLLGHAGLTSTILAKALPRIQLVREQTLGVFIFFGLCGAVSIFLPLLTTSDSGPSKPFTLGVIVGIAFNCVMQAAWLVRRQNEVFRLRVRLEGERRDEDSRNKALRELNETAKKPV